MADAVGTDGQFYWFQGIVEDIDDPLQLGRIKIRHITEYNPSSKEYVDTDDIPWAIPMTPANSASRFGVGTAPVGIDKGSFVVGFYLDGVKKTKPMVLGSWPVYNEDNDKHSVNEKARGIAPQEKEYLSYEPKTQYAAEYPHNKTYTTKRGHLIEIDDTPEGERIHVFHRSGSYIEMNPDGSVVTKSSDKEINISMKDKDIVVNQGNTSIISVDGSINIYSSEEINIVSKESTIYMEGVANIVSDKEVNIKAPSFNVWTDE